MTLDQILVNVARKVRSRTLFDMEKHKEGLHKTFRLHQFLEIIIFKQPTHQLVEEGILELRMKNLVKAHVLVHR